MVGCYPYLQQLSYEQPAQLQSQFKGKYTEYLDPSESPIIERYHYVISQDAMGHYIERRFFPETMTLTSEVRYRDKALESIDGLSTYWYDHGDMSKQGNYIGGKEDGTWSYYHRSTGELSEIGRYKLGDKVGTWKSYDDKGRLSAEYEYLNDIREGKFVTYDSLNTVTNDGLYKADTLYQQSNPPKPIAKPETFKVVEEMPRFYDPECEAMTDPKERDRCSQGKMLMHIYKNLKYPADAREYNVEGMTVVQFSVDTLGNITDLVTLKGICQSLQESSEAAVRSLPKWMPGMQGGKKVKVRYTLPLRYKLR